MRRVTLAPPLQIPPSLDLWKRQRTQIRSRLWQLLGKLPPRPAVPHITTRSRADCGAYVLETFQFDNGAGAVVPGYLLVPKGPERRFPAVLYCHQHGNDYELGKDELLRDGPADQPPGLALVRRGYVVLAIDAYGFGERSGAGPGGPEERGQHEELSASKLDLWIGRTLWGMILRDDLLALAYLRARPDVDARRVGVTGFSMGATRAWWLMALDERLRTAVAVACLTRYQDLIADRALAAHGIYYFVPRMLEFFDTEAVVALAAPRPILFLTGDEDRGSPTEGVKAIGARVRRVYGLYGRREAFQSVLYAGVDHTYLPEMWERMVRWMDEHLKRA